MGDDEPLAPLLEAVEDAHHFLHACERSYHGPAAFRRNLNTFIQAARNVTFRLQSLKATIPNFDEWHPAWQEHLRADPVMQWVNSARTQVVKRKGLAARSRAKYFLFYSYDEPISESVEVPPDTSTAEMVQQAIGRVPFNVRDRALVVIEREWVADGLPGHELLSALAKCLTTLLALTEDTRSRVSNRHMGTPADAVAAMELPNCLAGLNEARTIRIHPQTGELYTIGKQPLPDFDDEQGRTQIRKYQWPEESIKKYASLDPFEKAEGLADLSRLTLKVDGYHTSFALIRAQGGTWRPVAFAPEDQLDKYLLWHHIADLVREHHADAVLFVGEFWAARLDLLIESGVSDVEQAPKKLEQLVVFIETADGKHRAWITPFHHRLGKVVVEAQQVDDSYRPPMLQPVREVWLSGFKDIPKKKRSVLLGTTKSQSRLIDRVRAIGLHTPEGIERDPSVTLGLVMQAEPFVIDEIALYLALSDRNVLEDLGSLAHMQLALLPPNFFMEAVKPILSLANPYPSAWGLAFEFRTSRELKEDEQSRTFSHKGEVWEWILELAETFEWILTASLIVEHVPYVPIGPVADAFFGIQADGQARVLGFNPGATGRVLGVSEHDASRLAAALMAPATAAIQLLNQGEAKRSQFRPPRRESRRHRKKHGAPLTTYEVLSIELPYKNDG